MLRGRLILRLVPVLAAVVLICAAGCTARMDTAREPGGLVGNLTREPVHVVQNVRYVDSVGGNFLFRGAHPLVETNGIPPEFDYDALRIAIDEAGRDAGQEIPSNYTLIDVSLLWVENPQDNNHERTLLWAEDAFFTSHPELGRLHIWPMLGTRLDPADLSVAPHREYLAEHLDEWLPDLLISRVDSVRGWMEDPATSGLSGPVVVYVHCFGGCDRTGELIGAYSLRYMNKTWEEVRTLNGERCRPDRDYDEANCHALQWYGAWLNATYGRSLDWAANPPCSKRTGS